MTPPPDAPPVSAAPGPGSAPRAPGVLGPVVLGIETSCDETAAAVVDGGRRILANVVVSQLAQHAPYAGVVPEIAARAHVQALAPVVRAALAEAGLPPARLDAIAATAGPGLIGGVLVGATAAKAMALALGRPFLAVNHLEAHALTPRLVAEIAFPYLLLLVSGGHCQLLLVEAVGRYRRLGTTIDDAVGEAFDKVARLMGLGYPGGPAIEALAAEGPPDALARTGLPRPMLGRPGADFSFSGLKTAVRRAVEARPPGAMPRAEAALVARAFQDAVIATLADRSARALGLAREAGSAPTALVVAGGVAANRAIRAALEALAAREGVAFAAPPPALCTDNGAMVAWAGVERLRAGDPGDPLDFAPRPRWPLDPEAEPRPGAGIKA